MSENRLRWQARIGAIKPVALVVALLALVWLWQSVGDYRVARRNPSEPEEVAIGQVVSGEVSLDRYITIAGTALYGAGYEESNDGKVTATIYPVIDEPTGNTLFVRTTTPIAEADQNAQKAVVVSGMTRSTPSELRALIEGDLPDVEAAGLATTAGVYLSEGQAPGKAGSILARLIGLAAVLLACVATAPFPSTVFRPGPVQGAGAAAGGDGEAKATGRFVRLKSVEPAVEVGKGTRRFKEANANLVALEGGRLMVYIHFVTKYWGISVSKTHWAAFLERGEVIEAQAGKLYGWRERPAVQVRYKGAGNEVESLILSFGNAGAQAGFLDGLRELGFPVSEA